MQISPTISFGFNLHAAAFAAHSASKDRALSLVGNHSFF